MHVLVAMPGPGYLRNFEAGLGALLTRGHIVTLATPKVTRDVQPIVDRLARLGDWRIAIVKGVDEGPSSALGERLRTAIDYWHYLQPAFDDAPALRARVRADAPAFAVLAERAPAAVRRLAARLLRAVESRLPVPPSLTAFLESQAPDVLMLTPLIYVGSLQNDWLRAAQALGIPAAFGVHSWDNLTTKGVLHGVPDQTLVWNHAQREEAVRLHGLPPERIAITGATAYDHWFGRQPTLTRQSFIERLGLPADGSVILYLCSSKFIAPREAEWIDEWLAALRQAPDARVRNAAVIIRPHPQHAAQWESWRSSDRRVAVFPRGGENPVGDDARLSYFHSLVHSDAVVGINTSGLIEAAIVERPVLTVLVPRYAQTQRGTLHFGHLEHAGGGLVTVAGTIDAHLGDLADVLADRRGPERSRGFVAAFVRPMGQARSAGDASADVLEAMAKRRRPAPPARLPAWVHKRLVPFAEAAAAATDLSGYGREGLQGWFVPPRPTADAVRTRPLLIVAAPDATAEALSHARAVQRQGRGVMAAVAAASEADRRAFAEAGVKLRIAPSLESFNARRWFLFLRKLRPSAIAPVGLGRTPLQCLAEACRTAGLPLDSDGAGIG